MSKGGVGGLACGGNACLAQPERNLELYCRPEACGLDLMEFGGKEKDEAVSK